jgi:putative tricarboxylic transport membrane protein
MTIDRIGGIALFLMAGFVAFETRVLPLGTHQVPGPGYLPLLLALILGVLGLCLIFTKKKAPPFRSLKWPEGLHALALVACCFFATFAIDALGYRVTMILVLGFLFGVMERMKVWWVLLLTLGLSWGSYYIFNNVLMVILPRGGWGF